MIEEKSKIPQKVLDEIKRTGLIVCGSKGCGKTNAVKVILQDLLRNENIRVKIFDPVANFRFNFLNIPFIELNYTTSNYVYEIPPFVTLLHDVGFVEPNMRKNAITNLVMQDFILRREEKVNNYGNLFNWVIYCLEEGQNFIGTYGISGKSGKFWLVFVSEARNYNMGYIITTQRISDVSTKVIERCNGYLFGKAVGDNDLKKIRRISTDEVTEKVKKLGVGDFIYWSGELGYYHQHHFPLFTSNNPPYPVPKKRPFWQKIFTMR